MSRHSVAGGDMPGLVTCLQGVRGKHREFQSPLLVVDLFGTCAAETILANVKVRAYEKVGHMDASDPNELFVQALQE